jgi:aspartyl protease family protein
MGSGAKYALREALAWTGAALAAIAVVYFYDDLAAALRLGSKAVHQVASEAQDERPGALAAQASGFDREVRLKADERGHFVLNATINRRPVTLLADTGATLVVLSYDDAEKLGLFPRSLDFTGLVQTANGTARVAPLRLDEVRIADIALRDVPAAIAERGALPVNLLGMSFLGRLKSFQLSGGELVLAQ